MFDEPWTPQGALNVPQQDNPGYIRVPTASVRVGAIILWRGVACPVETVTPIGAMHVCLNIRYDGAICTDTFKRWDEIHVKREEGGESFE